MRRINSLQWARNSGSMVIGQVQSNRTVLKRADFSRQPLGLQSVPDTVPAIDVQLVSRNSKMLDKPGCDRWVFQQSAVGCRRKGFRNSGGCLRSILGKHPNKPERILEGQSATSTRLQQVMCQSQIIETKAVDLIQLPRRSVLEIDEHNAISFRRHQNVAAVEIHVADAKRVHGSHSSQHLRQHLPEHAFVTPQHLRNSFPWHIVICQELNPASDQPWGQSMNRQPFIDSTFPRNSLKWRQRFPRKKWLHLRT